MLFNSLHFLTFFPIVVGVYFIIPGKIRYGWLLLSSYYFYMCWNPKYVLLLLLSTVVTFGSSLLIAKCSGKICLKRLVVFGCLLINFGILFLFKYLDFTLNILKKLHISVSEKPLNLLLPVGISFYIFQAVGYTIDVYRGTIKPEKNFFRYALFVSFFPQLVAGPIERSSSLLKQLKKLDEINLWNAERIQSGALIMLYGYIMKMIIADRAAIFVDTVFNIETFINYTGIPVLIAAMLFSLQIYCDFAGYTYIAIGAAQIMGIKLGENFRMPYSAVSIKDFWNRWHISLTSWFRDYVYIPLGGSKKGKLRKYLNIMIVFSVSGLWHGASWHYVVWGALHGFFRIAGEITKSFRDKIWKKLHVHTEVFSFRLWQMCFTFLLVSLAWIFFRAASTRQAISIICQIFAQWNPWTLFDGSLLSMGLDGKEWNVLIAAILALVAVDFMRYRKIHLTEHFAKQNLLFRVMFFYVGILAVIVFGVYGANYDATQFIYFQF